MSQQAAYSTSKTRQLPQLTSLRFFAAFAVLVFHLGFLRLAPGPLGSLAKTVFDEGYAGVCFFFILSGFIISHTYEDNLRSGHVSGQQYACLRLARILPMHWLAAVFVAPFVDSGGNALQNISNVLLLQAWVPDSNYYFSLNGVAWTLSVEMFFYVSFVYLARLSTRSITWLCAIWMTAIGVSASIVVWRHGAWLVNGQLTLNHWVFCISPVTRLLEFLVGIIIYRLTIEYPASKRFGSEGFSVLLLIGVILFYSTHKFSDILRYQLLYLPFMGYVVFSFTHGSGPLSVVLRRREFVILGNSSFSLYLIHQPIIDLAYGAYTRSGLALSLALLAFLLSGFCIALSVIVYEFVEHPIQQYLKRKIDRLGWLRRDPL